VGVPLELLFVTHTLDPGGARRSLRELIRNYRDVACDLVVPRVAKMTDAEIRELFGPNIRNIYRFWLPFELCYRGRAKFRVAGPRWLAYALLWKAETARFYRLARRYDAIHLNSIVLHPMIDAKLPFVIHVREIVDRDFARVRRNVGSARGAIFIDEATRAPFEPAMPRRSIVLNNAVDMTGVGAPPRDAAPRLGADPSTLTIVAIIGSLMPEKGVDRVIRAFRQTTHADLRLVVVGSGTSGEEATLRVLARDDRRIVLWGFEPEVDPIYAMADYVVRGESYACVGRTIYEALYAGCGVVIPGSETDHAMFEYERFRSRVHFYTPGDEVRLRDVLEALANHKMIDKRGESNTDEHVRAFDRFVREATR
jgi:glycosyltransferase involved in cell wall biosynthesis